jgi:hypothetical protein
MHLLSHITAVMTIRARRVAGIGISCFQSPLPPLELALRQIRHRSFALLIRTGKMPVPPFLHRRAARQPLPFGPVGDAAARHRRPVAPTRAPGQGKAADKRGSLRPIAGAAVARTGAHRACQAPQPASSHARGAARLDSAGELKAAGTNGSTSATATRTVTARCAIAVNRSLWPRLGQPFDDGSVNLLRNGQC